MLHYMTPLQWMLNSNKKLHVSKINGANWNILITPGKQIKRDFLSNVNERRKVLKVKWSAYLFEYKGNLPLRLNMIYKR